MLSKTQSCDKCLRTGRVSESYGHKSKNIVRKPEEYLSKKFEELYVEDRKWKQKKQLKREETIKIKEQKEVQSCTFKPEINNNPQYHIASEPFLKRQSDWKRNLDKKISEKRDQKAQREALFTFQPKITPSPQQSRTTYNSGTYTLQPCYMQKKSYKVLHSERKKFKQIARATIVEPFQHRRVNTMTASQTFTQVNEPIQTQQSIQQVPFSKLDILAKKVQQAQQIDDISYQHIQETIAEFQKLPDESIDDKNDKIQKQAQVEKQQTHEDQQQAFEEV